MISSFFMNIARWRLADCQEKVAIGFHRTGAFGGRKWRIFAQMKLLALLQAAYIRGFDLWYGLCNTF